MSVYSARKRLTVSDVRLRLFVANNEKLLTSQKTQFTRTQSGQEPMFRSRRSTSENNPAASKLEVKARNIANDAEKAVLVGLIPLLGLAFILRVVQWHLLRPSVEADQTIDKNVRYRFMNSKIRLWAAVLLWPAIIVIVWAGFLITA